MFKKTVLGIAAAASVAVGTMAVSTGEAEARNRAGAAVAAGIIGLAAGAIIASQARPAYGYYYQPRPVYYRPVRYQRCWTEVRYNRYNNPYYKRVCGYY